MMHDAPGQRDTGAHDGTRRDDHHSDPDRQSASASLRHDLTRAISEMASAGILLERAQRACDPQRESDIAAALSQLRHELRALTRRAATCGEWLRPRQGRGQ